MYAKYTYDASTSAANLLADLVKILTGTTDKTLLSADCDQANTEIITTYEPAGWVVHDAIAGTNAVCLKAACQGDATQFKYVVVDTNTAGYILLKGYESWNATTHVGTNVVMNSNTTTHAQRWSTSQIGTVDISATNKHLLVYGVSGANSGTSGATGSVCGMFEFGRNKNKYGVGQGYTPVVYINNLTPAASTNGLGRYHEVLSDAATAGGATCTVSPPANDPAFPGIAGSLLSRRQMNGVGVLGPVPIWPLFIQHSNNAFFLVTDYLLSAWEIWGYGANRDTLVLGGETYIVVGGQTGVKLIVKKG